jgi:hypothetical protein
MEKEYKNGKMVINTLDNGRIIKDMEMGSIFGKMVKNI